MARSGFQPTTSHSRGEHSTHWATASIFNISDIPWLVQLVSLALKVGLEVDVCCLPGAAQYPLKHFNQSVHYTSNITCMSNANIKHNEQGYKWFFTVFRETVIMQWVLGTFLDCINYFNINWHIHCKKYINMLLEFSYTTTHWVLSFYKVSCW